MEFGQPYYLILLLILPILIFWYFKKGQNQEATVRFSNLDLIPETIMRSGQIKNMIIVMGRLLIMLFIIPLAVQWWSAWYPGAEPGGGGYIAQRMLAAKDENHAIGATFFFNIMHYALRPWPWILVAFCTHHHPIKVS